MTDELQVASASAPSEPIVNIRGERVALGPLHRGLLPRIERWDNEFRTVDLGGDDPRPHSAESIAATWEPLLRGEREDWLRFAIYALRDLRPIGILTIRDFGNPHGTAEFGITIGDAADRRQRFGTEATKLLLDSRSPCLGCTTSGWSESRKWCDSEPAGEESCLPRIVAAVSRDPSFLRMTRRSGAPVHS
jgi:hypothetical protein